MKWMFSGAKAFNQPLNNWNVSNVTSMNDMFNGASAFKNHDLSNWKVSKVIYHGKFFNDIEGNGNTPPKWKK
jgi:surface protein